MRICLIRSSLEENLGMLREVVWAVSLCVAYVSLSIYFGDKTTH